MSTPVRRSAYLPSELVAAVNTLKLPHALMATQMNTKLLLRW